jgi:hypothetical protein
MKYWEYAGDSGCKFHHNFVTETRPILEQFANLCVLLLPD